MHPTRSGGQLCSTLSLLLGALALSPGCGKVIPDVTTATIGSKGGTVHDAACGLTLQIPAGALSSDTLFVVTESDGGAPISADRALASVICTVTPPVLFNTPANVTMVFDPSRVPPDSTASDADLRLSEGGSSEIRLQGNSVSVSTATVSATTPGSGGFYVTVPATPAPSSITVNPAGGVALTVGQTAQFSAQVFDAAGDPAYDQTIVWSTTSTAIATVDATGVVIAVSPGYAQVVASSNQSGIGGDGGALSGTADVYVVSATPSPSGFGWENPLPQGNDIHGLSLADGVLLIAANNGTVVAAAPDGGFVQLLSAPGLSLAGAVVGAGQLGTAGTVDEVIQGIENLSAVAVDLTPSGPLEQVFTTSIIQPIAMYGDSQGVIAVGAGNDALLLAPGDGGWTPLDTPVSEALLSVAADPTSGRRVVGARGQVYREDNAAWFPIWDQPLETLFSFTTSIGHSAYATDEGLVLHQFAEGTGWSDDSIPPGVALDHIDLLSSLGGSLAFSAVDTGLVPHLWVRPTSTWTEVTGIAATDELYALASEPDGGGFVGGSAGALYAVVGGQLTELRTGSIEDIVGLGVGADGSAFATSVGACLDAACSMHSTHFLVRQPGASWAPLESFTQTGYALRAVAAHSSSDAVVVGDNGQAYHWDGNTLAALPSPSADGADLLAAQVCGSDLWVSGASALLARYDGVVGFAPASIPVANAGAIYALGCTSASDIWAAGDYTLFHYDGSKWSNVNTGSVNPGPWRSIMVDANEIWVGGAADFLLHTTDRMNWEAVQNPAGLTLHAVNGLWEAAPGDGYLVGSTQEPSAGVMLRWDGALWNAIDPGTDHVLLSINGVPGPPATRQIWIGGASGSLLRALP